MATRYLLPILAVLAAVACGRDVLETRTFELRYLDAGMAEGMVVPYVYTDRPKAPGKLSTTRRTITVRETGDNLERIARVLAEHDRPPVNVRLHYLVIRADGAGAADTGIAAIETQLRQLFRFRGYRLAAQAVAVGTEGSRIEQQVSGEGGPYAITTIVESVRSHRDSGTVRVGVELLAHRIGKVLETVLNVRVGQTAVLGSGQPGGGPGAIILAVRPELVAP